MVATRAGNTNWKHSCGAEPELEEVAGNMEFETTMAAGGLAMPHLLRLALSVIEEVIDILPI